MILWSVSVFLGAINGSLHKPSGNEVSFGFLQTTGEQPEKTLVTISPASRPGKPVVHIKSTGKIW